MWRRFTLPCAMLWRPTEQAALRVSGPRAFSARAQHLSQPLRGPLRGPLRRHARGSLMVVLAGLLGLLALVVVALQLWYLAHIVWWRSHPPASTSFMRAQLAVLRAQDPNARIAYQWVPYERIAPHLKRAAFIPSQHLDVSVAVIADAVRRQPRIAVKKPDSPPRPSPQKLSDADRQRVDHGVSRNAFTSRCAHAHGSSLAELAALVFRTVTSTMSCLTLSQ